jgi:3'-phosphoadenosine 5'-phosphosulfate sulfotransferase (PAPS reductase)/FAD synthetase
MNPYLIESPAVISFSGGRTSGYMLYHILEAHGGTLPEGIKVIFCNTGKERPETLDFVERCSQRWGVPITWLEYRYQEGLPLPEMEGSNQKAQGKHTFAVVDYSSASRNGEPFEALILAKNCLPNVMTRFCTSEMKIRTNSRYLKSIGWTDWENAIGIRHDEPRRVAKILGRKESKSETPILPLNNAKVTLDDVARFWSKSPFDLQLRHDEGNCDLCFLKGPSKIRRLIADRPESAEWWARMETLIPSPIYGTSRFRNDRPGYAKLIELAQRPGLFDAIEDEDELSISCHCTD